MFQQESDGLESERDHRRLGRELELFSFEDAVGPGLALWHPKGGLVRHLLEDYWRKEQITHGYQLVYSPHVGRSVLWETSGHLDFYRDSMFPPIEADDLNLPRRFGLSYVGPDGAAHRPFVLHRAIFGSLERFFAILVEHYRGAFPFWLAPVQARVLPVAERHCEKAQEAVSKLRDARLRVELDSRGEPLSARVRDSELEKVPFLLVIGDREIEGGTVSVRRRGSSERQGLRLSEWIAQLLGHQDLTMSRPWRSA